MKKKIITIGSTLVSITPVFTTISCSEVFKMNEINVVNHEAIIKLGGTILFDHYPNLKRESKRDMSRVSSELIYSYYDPGAKSSITDVTVYFNSDGKKYKADIYLDREDYQNAGTMSQGSWEYLLNSKIWDIEEVIS